MGDLEKILPIEITSSNLWPGNAFVLLPAEASSAVGIATEHQIANLGFEAFEVRKNGSLTVALNDPSVHIPFKTGSTYAELWSKHGLTIPFSYLEGFLRIPTESSPVILASRISFVNKLQISLYPRFESTFGGNISATAGVYIRHEKSSWCLKWESPISNNEIFHRQKCKGLLGAYAFVCAALFDGCPSRCLRQ
jgi:hypothetical protein